jgi:hypothetical protein
MLNKAVSGHQHYYTPLHIPMAGLSPKSTLLVTGVETSSGGRLKILRFA